MRSGDGDDGDDFDPGSDRGSDRDWERSRDRFRRRGRNEGDFYRDRERKIAYAQRIVGQIPKFKLPGNFSMWFQSFLMSIKFMDLDLYESRIYLLGHILDPYLQSQIAIIMKENPSIDMTELGVQISLTLGDKSRELSAAESYNIKRRNKESIFSWALRSKTAAIDQLMHTEPEPDKILHSRYFDITALRIFERGLRSKYLVSHIEDKDCTNINHAVTIITKRLAKDARVKSLVGDSDLINSETDQNLFSEPREAHFFAANNILDEDELDAWGHSVNTVVSGCKSCGQSHSLSELCPAQDRVCYGCGSTGHIKRLCPSGNPLNKPDIRGVKKQPTPAMIRNGLKKKRKAALNNPKKVNQIGNDEEEEEDEEEDEEDADFIELDENPFKSGSESDDDEQLVNAMKSLKARFGNKKVKKHLRRINTLTEYRVEDECINALSSLPFVHGSLIDKVGNEVKAKFLIDSGSSCTLISKAFIDRHNLVYLPIPYDSTLVAFSGATVNCHSKGKFKVKLVPDKIQELQGDHSQLINSKRL